MLLSNSDNFESVAREIVQAAIGDVYSPFDWLGYVPFDPSQVKTPPPEPVAIAVLALGVVIAVAAGVIADLDKPQAACRSRLRDAAREASRRLLDGRCVWRLGVVLGLPLGSLIGDTMGGVGIGLALGPGMGVAIGVAIGAALEQRHQGETRPLTSYERRARRWMTWGGIAVLALLAVIAAARRRGVAAPVNPRIWRHSAGPRGGQ